MLVIFSSGLSDSTLAMARPGEVRARLRNVVDLQPVHCPVFVKQSR